MTHDDGTPMSTDNAFFWNTGEPTVFMKDPRFNKYARTGLIATEAVEKMRADRFNIPIMSREESDRTQSIRNSIRNSK